VLWLNEDEREAILFELKTKKAATSLLKKEDVGQGFNHLQWMSTAQKNVSPLGLIYVCDSQACSNDASPSDAMWLVGTSAVKQFFYEVIQTLEALQRMEPLERYPELNAMSNRPEWRPKGIFDKIRARRLQDAKSK
jgi:hypothetical protein